MRCLGCKAWKNGKCLAGIVPYRSKKEKDGVGCACNLSTVEKLMRDAKIFQIFEGTNQIQRVAIAKCLEKEYE